MSKRRTGMVEGEISGRKKAPLVLRVTGKIFKGLGMTVMTLALVAVLTIVFVRVYAQGYIESMRATTAEELMDIGNNTFRQLGDTVVYGADGSKIGEINTINYEYVTFSEISDYLIDGYVAVEDRRFYEHKGIDWKAVARAAVSLVKNGGNITQGGSTITQQVLKNNLIDPSSTKIGRKLQELFMAPEFEKMYSKAQIMEFYANTNFYANNIYGVGQASKYYFGKSCKDLTLAEAAGLVGLSNSPTTYDPVRHPEEFVAKRHFILKTMMDQGAITQAEFEQADAEELTLVLEWDSKTKENYMTSYAIHDATERLMGADGFKFKYVFTSEEEQKAYEEEYDSLYNAKSAEIRRGGYTIYTELDPNIQAIAQEAVDRRLETFKQQSVDGRYSVQGSVSVVDNQSGYVAAVVGGRGTDDEFNRAYQSRRQPGSSIKPLLVYGPAFDSGNYYPSLKMNDSKSEDGPANASLSYAGNVSLATAIARSLNTVADQVWTSMSTEYKMEYLEKIHMNGVSWQDYGIRALALGGFTYGVSTVDMAKGYATIANYGEYINVGTVTRIEYEGSGVIWSSNEEKSTAYTEDTAYMLIDCMRGVFTDPYGTAAGLSIEGVDVAGKTGTTNGKKDSWFCGMNTSYSAAVWVGSDQPRTIDDLSRGKYAVNIWLDVMREISKGLEGTTFERPSTCYESWVDWKGEKCNYNSGEKGLFSQINDDIRAAREAEENRERFENEDTALGETLTTQFRSFQSYGISSMDDIPKYDKAYKNLLTKINGFHSEALKSDWKTKVTAEYNERNLDMKVEAYRAEYDAAVEEQKRLEEEKRKAAEEEAIEAAESAIEALEGVDKASAWRWEQLKLEADSAVSRLAELGLTEQAEKCQERITNMEYIFRAYINTTPNPTGSPVETQAPSPTPTHGWPAGTLQPRATSTPAPRETGETLSPAPATPSSTPAA